MARALRFRGMVLVGLVSATPLAAQTNAPAKPASKMITLSGCVARSGSTPDQYTLSEVKGGAIYKLTGTNVREYVGRRVEIVGQVPRRFTIATGLTPTANVAAQAGAMDPTRAAVASAGGSAGPGTVDLPEFRVKSVKPVGGSCGN
ncbi:MAG: hypothetical protein HY047_11390 [Acidobacteria bacterium]|nr:hypothetical protein [Acidobacteriota bacterium]